MDIFYEILGYVASLVVLVSLLMSSVKRLRWINMFGSMIFAAYGFLIGAIPVAIMNLGIVMINIYYLYQMYTKKDYFSLLPITDTTYFNHFMTFYQDNMKSFMDVEKQYDDPSFVKLFILRNMVPAGIVIGSKKSSDTFEIHIDYVTPAYRDFKVGEFLYEAQKSYFIEQGFKKLVSKPGNDKHQMYLKRMGFIEEKAYFVKKLAELKS
jgi:GNAT superfamily N-acetyltransferase